MTTKILSAMQAANVFNAMCELNNIGALIHARLFDTKTPGLYVHVKEHMTDEVNVWDGDSNGHPCGQCRMERYTNQSEFRDAYGLGD
jgi:hypothetical protein